MYSGVEVNTRHLLCQRTGTTGTAREGMRPAVHAHAPPAARPCAHRSCGCCAHAGPAQSGYRSAGSLRVNWRGGRGARARRQSEHAAQPSSARPGVPQLRPGTQSADVGARSALVTACAAAHEALGAALCVGCVVVLMCAVVVGLPWG